MSWWPWITRRAELAELAELADLPAVDYLVAVDHQARELVAVDYQAHELEPLTQQSQPTARAPWPVARGPRSQVGGRSPDGHSSESERSLTPGPGKRPRPKLTQALARI